MLFSAMGKMLEISLRPEHTVAVIAAGGVVDERGGKADRAPRLRLKLRGHVVIRILKFRHMASCRNAGYGAQIFFHDGKQRPQ